MWSYVAGTHAPFTSLSANVTAAISKQEEMYLRGIYVRVNPEWALSSEPRL